jgi:hypothetical protein
MTSNADDFRKLVLHAETHPGLAILLDAVGREQQIELGTTLANEIDAVFIADGNVHGRVFEIDA